MSKFDVIVIGAGPAGCYAALAAATRGCRVAVFEEHSVIGWPRHDPGWLMESEFAESLLAGLGRSIAWTKVQEYRLCHAESGELVEKASPGGYLTRRDILEKEIAARAVRAGAELYMKTKVTGLIRKGGRVAGVETSSGKAPAAEADVFICADGIRSARHGLAAGEGLCREGEIRMGISHLLANADVFAGIIEHFLSPEPALNYRTFWPQGDGVCFFGAPSAEAYAELKAREDNVVSRKIKNAAIMETSGYARASSGKYGQYFPVMVKDNILFVGDASGGAGNVHGMIQGRFAGTVAASAVKEKDTSEGRLGEYQDLVGRTLGKAPFFYHSAREDFGSFSNWFRAFADSIRGIEATEVASVG